MSRKLFLFTSLQRFFIFTSLLATLILANAASLGAQTNQTPAANQYSTQLLADLKRIQAAALESDYAYRQVARLTNNIGPRLSGSAQAQAAVEYVAKELRRIGLDVQLEKVIVPHWVRGVETGALVEFPGQAPNTTQKIILTALGGSVATQSDGLIAPIIVVNNFDELRSLAREQVAGKIVLFNYRFDERMAQQGFGGEAYGQAVAYRGGAPSAAARMGAVAALVRSVGGAEYRLPHTGATRYAKDAPEIPAAAVTAEDADLIANLTTEGQVRLRLTLTPQRLPDAVSYNVIGDLKGSEHPEQIVIVSGHLDSWDLGTGAIDDASGVGVAMQAAQLLKQLNLRPKRTLRVVAWMNEENGVAGGRTYAENHKADAANHIAAIESDLGAGHPLGFEVKARPEVMPLLAPVSALLQTSGAGLSKLVESTETDITPLANLGVPAFGIWQDSRTYFNYHHTAADTLDKVKPRELAENAAVMSVLAYALANLPQMLPR
jgi:carboxypeptidase Q